MTRQTNAESAVFEAARWIACAALLLAFIAPAKSAAQIAEIIDSQGDGMSAFVGPRAIAVDSSDNVYVAGFGSSNVFRITSGGTITKIIDFGNGLSLPTDIAVDSSNNVYVTGAASANAFQITPGGTITQIIDSTGDGAGNILNQAYGIAVDSNLNVYVSGEISNNVFKITPAGTITEIIDKTGAGGEDRLASPRGVAVDSVGNVYVTGTVLNNVFQVTPGGTITKILDSDGVVGGNGIDFPEAIAVDSVGNVYVTGALSNNAFEISRSGIIREIINETDHGLVRPRGIVVDPIGNVYVAGENRDNAFAISPSGVVTEIITSTGEAGGNGLAGTFDVAVDSSGNAYVVGRTSDNAFVIAGVYSPPDGICDEADDIYSPDCFGLGCTNPPQAQGAPVPAYSQRRPEPGFSAASGIGCQSANPQPDPFLTAGTILVADRNLARIYSVLGFDSSLTNHGTQKLFAEGDEMVSPHGLAVGPEGDVWVSDIGSEIGVVNDGKIIRIGFASREQSVILDGVDASSAVALRNPVDLQFDSCGNLFIVDQGVSAANDGALIRFDRQTQKFSYELSPGELYSPWGIAIRKDGTILISDTEVDQGFIYRLERPVCSQAGFVRSTIVGPVSSGAAIEHAGELNFLKGIAIEPGGNLLVLDTRGEGPANRGQLFRISLSEGTITEHASGADGGRLNQPFGVLVEPLGRIFVADRGDPIVNSCAGEEDGILIEIDPFPGIAGQTRYSPETACTLDETQLCEPSGIAIVSRFGSGDVIAGEPGPTGEIVQLPQIGIEPDTEDPIFDNPQIILPACIAGDPCSNPGGINRLNPQAIALSPAGGLFVADPGFGQEGGGRIVAVDPAKSERRRVVSGDFKLNFLIHPTSLNFTPTGELLVLDTGGPEPVLIQIDPLTGVQTCVADESAAASASYSNPASAIGEPIPDGGQVTQDLAGNAYITSPSTGDILVQDLATGETEVLLCGGAAISEPSGIKFAPGTGTLFVTDADQNAPGLLEITLGPPCSAELIASGMDFMSPISVALECEDEVLIADPVAGTLVRVRLRNRRTSSSSFPTLTPNSIVRVCNPLPIPEPGHRPLAIASLIVLAALRWRSRPSR